MKPARIVVLLFVCGTLFTAGLALCGEPEGKGHDDAAVMHGHDEAAMMKAMKLGKQHKDMEFYLGDWTYTSTTYMGPEPVSSEGSASWKWAMDGRYLMGSYDGNMMGMPFHGMSLDGYDNVTGEYFNIWMDNMGTGYMESRGKEDGKSIVLTGTSIDPSSGKEVGHKMVTTHVDDNSFDFAMYMKMGDEEMKVMEVKYQRKK